MMINIYIYIFFFFLGGGGGGDRMMRVVGHVYGFCLVFEDWEMSIHFSCFHGSPKCN